VRAVNRGHRATTDRAGDHVVGDPVPDRRHLVNPLVSPTARVMAPPLWPRIVARPARVPRFGGDPHK
jgi:hypothetical protein